MIKLDVTRPPADERAGIQVFDATDAENHSLARRVIAACQSLGAGEFSLRTRRCRCRSFARRSDVAIMTVALDRLTTRFANYALERRHCLLLRSRGASHVENFFLDDG